MVSLRSKCHSAKMNFSKLYRSDLKCRLGCDTIEDQVHIFTQCKYSANTPHIALNYEDLFKDSVKQKTIIKSFLQIEKRRVFTKIQQSTWGDQCQGPCTVV